MISYELIKAYMNAKNYSQDKQAAMDLALSKQMISMIKAGDRFLTEETAIYIAERCNIDVSEVLIKLQAEKAKSESEKAAWLTMLKKYNNGINSINSMALTSLIALVTYTFDFAYCILC